MEQLREQSVAAFAEKLASSAPTPGGGAAAALCGALAAALCAMASRLTAGRKKYADRAEDLKCIVSRSDELRQRLLLLIDEDAENFAPLAAAYSLPKGEAGTAEALRSATLTACEAPMEMLRCSAAAVELLETAETLCSPLLLSDVGCGASLARCSMECAAMNVRVNTRSLPEDPEARYLEEELSRLLETWLPRAEAVSASVMRRLQRL